MTLVKSQSCYLGWPLALVEEACRRDKLAFEVEWTVSDRLKQPLSKTEAFVVRQHISAEGIYQFIAVSKVGKEVQDSGLQNQ